MNGYRTAILWLSLSACGTTPAPESPASTPSPAVPPLSQPAETVEPAPVEPSRVEVPKPDVVDDDRDRDGIADADDVCPAEPELINERDDHDGCPDEGTFGIKLVGPTLIKDGKIEFETGKVVVRAESMALVEELGRIVRLNPHLGKVVIEAHTDPRGSSAYNMALSQGRADAVREVFLRVGVPADRVKAVGMGDERPIVCNTCPPGDFARSRRIEIRFPELDVR